MLSRAQRKLLQQRVAETVAWCTPRVDPTDPSGCLRSPEVMPPSFGGTWKTRDTHDVTTAVVEAIATRRAELLEQLGVAPAPPGRAGGRIHIRETGRDLASGAGAVASHDYVDWDDLPPWDTWLMHIDEGPGFLLSWVPPAFLVLTGRAFQVCEMDCSQWADRRRYDESWPGLIVADLETLGFVAPPGSPGDPEADPEPGWLSTPPR